MADPIREEIIALSSSFSESEIMKALFRLFYIGSRYKISFISSVSRVILIVFRCFVFRGIYNRSEIYLIISRLPRALQDNEWANLYHYLKVQTSLHYYRKKWGREGKGQE